MNIDELLVDARYLKLLDIVANDLWQEKSDKEGGSGRPKRVGLLGRSPMTPLGGADLKREEAFGGGTEGEEVVLTGIIRATHLGDRVPMLPHHKEGLVYTFIFFLFFLNGYTLFA